MEPSRRPAVSNGNSLEFEGQKLALGEEFVGEPHDLIPMLQKAQKTVGYLPEEILREIARLTGVSLAKVYGVATFYSQFRLQPIGQHSVRVCRGTACHVRGSNRILKDIQSHLHVTDGETTEDRLFTLETVACFGSCALAPVVVVDDSVCGRMNTMKIRTMLDDVRAQADEAPEEESDAQ